MDERNVAEVLLILGRDNPPIVRRKMLCGRGCWPLCEKYIAIGIFELFRDTLNDPYSMPSGKCRAIYKKYEHIFKKYGIGDVNRIGVYIRDVKKKLTKKNQDKKNIDYDDYTEEEILDIYKRCTELYENNTIHLNYDVIIG